METTQVKDARSEFKIRTNVIYSCPIESLTVNLGGVAVDATNTLRSGRTNYEIFESIICKFLPLRKGVKIDLVDLAGNTYEVKAFKDSDAYPGDKATEDKIHTAASKAFGPNSNGKLISGLIKSNEYEKALSICRELSYDRTNYFIYTNTCQFDNSQPFKFIVVKKDDVMNQLDPKDPRCISRRTILTSCTETVFLSLR